jgi:tRNA pseudouridine38-40 synthase
VLNVEDLPKNLKMIIAYEGTAYSGFQIQKNGPTVQAELKAVIEHITGETVDLQGAGRTDAGVHARGQVVHFHTHSNLSVEKLKKALNSLLPADIVVRNICEVSMDFHARHSAVSKTYSYCLYNSEERPLFERNYVYHYKAVLNITKMKEAVPFLLGKKDFKSFQAKGSAVLTTIRVVNFCHLELKGSLIVFTINANGFLYHMVRNIIGTLILIGREKINPSEMEQIIMGKDRAMAGETAPAMGLCLEEVLY